MFLFFLLCCLLPGHLCSSCVFSFLRRAFFHPGLSCPFCNNTCTTTIALSPFRTVSHRQGLLRKVSKVVMSLSGMFQPTLFGPYISRSLFHASSAFSASQAQVSQETLPRMLCFLPYLLNRASYSFVLYSPKKKHNVIHRPIRVVHRRILLSLNQASILTCGFQVNYAFLESNLNLSLILMHASDLGIWSL